MTDAIDIMREFIASYPDFDMLGALQIDYTSNVPNCGGLFPSGLVEIRRRRDILGNVESDRQANFALYAVLTKSPEDDAGATYNAEWLMGFQEWVLEQSALGLAPRFGDVPEAERMVAQNGQVYESDEEGWAVYVIQITAAFTRAIPYWRALGVDGVVHDSLMTSYGAYMDEGGALVLPTAEQAGDTLAVKASS